MSFRLFPSRYISGICVSSMSQMGSLAAIPIITCVAPQSYATCTGFSLHSRFFSPFTLAHILPSFYTNWTAIDLTLSPRFYLGLEYGEQAYHSKPTAPQWQRQQHLLA